MTSVTKCQSIELVPTSENINKFCQGFQIDIRNVSPMIFNIETVEAASSKNFVKFILAFFLNPPNGRRSLQGYMSVDFVNQNTCYVDLSEYQSSSIRFIDMYHYIVTIGSRHAFYRRYDKNLLIRNIVMRSLPIRLKKKTANQYQILVAANMRLNNYQLKSNLQFYPDHYQFLDA